MKTECVDEIKKLLLPDNADKANSIYDAFARKKLIKVAILDLMYTFYSKGNDACREMIDKYDLDVFDDAEATTVEALHAYQENVGTTVATEALNPEVSDWYREMHELNSDHHFEHYADVNRYVHIDDRSVITVMALDCIYNGYVNNTSAEVEYKKACEGYTISEATANAFREIFKDEEKILHETHAAQAIASLEVFSTKDPELDSIVRNVKKYNAREFKKHIHEGDIVITYRKAKYIGMGGVILNKLNAKLTGSSFMSCKLIGPKAESVIGYGTVIKDSSSSCQQVPIDYYIETCSGILCLQHKKITPDKRRKILDYAKKVLEVGVPYSFWDIIKIIFSKNEKIKKLTKEEATHYFTPMICTTFAVAAYKSAGLEMNGIVDDEKSWPIDVAKCIDLIPVAAYFDSDQFK